MLALGNFDGVHRGHQRLLRYVVRQARDERGCAAVFTFQQHPQHVLHPEHHSENLQSLDQKLQFFKNFGIEICFLQKFNRSFARLSAKDFVKRVLIKKLGIQEICLGYNARFGRGRQGDADLLKQMGKSEGFRVFQAEPVLWRGNPVSSTAVREALRQGKMDVAAGCLGRFWSLEGTVYRGDGRGRQLGFPTANLDLGEFVQPARGVYVAQIQIAKQTRMHDAVVNVGTRPSFGGAERVCVEAHVLNFKQNLYGKKIEVFFIKRLRNEKKFSSSELLKKQIFKDIQKARFVLRRKAN